MLIASSVIALPAISMPGAWIVVNVCRPNVDVQLMSLTPGNAYFARLEHVYIAYTTRSLIRSHFDLCTTHDLPHLLQHIIDQYETSQHYQQHQARSIQLIEQYQHPRSLRTLKTSIAETSQNIAAQRIDMFRPCPRSRRYPCSHCIEIHRTHRSIISESFPSLCNMF